jgi:DNA-binding GntR family transcriptional regulator
MFKGLDDYQRSYFEEYALYLFLEEKFSVSTISNVQLSAVTLADEATAKLLKVEKGHPLLVLEMLAFTHKDKPYEYRISYCLTDERKLRRIIL